MAKRGWKMDDDRGRERKICTIWRATRASGYDKGYLVRGDETARFWTTFLMTGPPFAVLMQGWFVFQGRLMSGDWGRVFSPVFVWIFVFELFFSGGAMAGLAKLYAWRSPQHARRAMLRAGLCVSCAYLLDGCESGPDGCTVCPECGGAWKIDAESPATP